jgi:hypothetical protein
VSYAERLIDLANKLRATPNDNHAYTDERDRIAQHYEVFGPYMEKSIERAVRKGRFPVCLHQKVATQPLIGGPTLWCGGDGPTYPQELQHGLHSVL